MSRQMHGLKKVIWAVDAFERQSPIRKHTERMLETLAKRTDAEIQPVFVLTPAELNLSIEFIPPWMAQYRPAAESALENIMHELPLPTVAKPEVLVQNSVSNKRAAKKLADYAKKEKADVIVVGTHARSGFTRMLLGSFAETLIMHSDVPVMVSGPVQKNGGRLDHILFPTDLCDFTTPMLRHAIALAQQLKAKLTLFHAIPNPVEPILQSGMFLLGGSWVPVHTYFARDLEHRKRRLETMVKMARKAGVSADFYVHEASGSISGAILDYTKKHKVGMVIMAAQSGPVTANLIGSIARQVVRHTICPVWIIHAAHLKASHLKISKQAPRQYRQAA